MQRNMITCDCCGKEITDTSLRNTMEVTSTWIDGETGQPMTTKKNYTDKRIDFCDDCYIKILNFISELGRVHGRVLIPQHEAALENMKHYGKKNQESN